jgi:hypothetical protein
MAWSKIEGSGKLHTVYYYTEVTALMHRIVTRCTIESRDDVGISVCVGPGYSMYDGVGN